MSRPGPATPATSRWEIKRWHYRRSLASRVALLTTIAVGVALAAVSLITFVTVRMQMQVALDDSLLDRAHKAAASPTLSDITASLELPSWMLGAADVRIIFITANGQARSFDRGPTLRLGAPELAVAAGQQADSVRTVVADGVNYRVVAVPTEKGQALVVAQPLTSQERTLRRLSAALIVAAGLGVLAAALAGWAVARNGLRPVRHLTNDVERIARTEDLAPLPVEGHDEVARLATAFNHVLLALSASQERQRRLVADAGHELRTPLTSLRTNVDLLLQSDRTGGLPPEARAELLSDVRAQIEELTTLIGDLMELARDDPNPESIEQLELSEVAGHALARVRRRAPGITFAVETAPWWLEGDPAALERAVTNLLDNAVKWSPPSGTITMRLSRGTLTVDDQGPGINPADLPHVFERFYRADESRTMTGSGLGLAIVRQVADRHGGSAEAGAAPGGGARLTLRVPGHPVQQAPALDEETATDRTRATGVLPSSVTRRTPRRRPSAP